MHSSIATLRRAASTESTVNAYFFFTIIQDSKYWQVFTFGSQLATSLSPLDLFNRSETATNALLSVKSFANACRCAGVQAQAPDRQASARGTRWSISKLENFVVTLLS